METQQKKNPLLDAWGLWCRLPSDKRNEMVSQLGAVGQLLNIATNVQKIAATMTEKQNTATSTSTSNQENNDDDVIEAEWEESK